MKATAAPKRHIKLILFLLAFSLFIAFIAIYFGVVQRQPKLLSAQEIKIEGIVLPSGKKIADFQLTDNNGKPFTKENLKGHWTMLFFGFTNCGNVCPTTMVELNKMYKTLQAELPDNKLPQVVLISVDPERDTVEKMDAYVRAYNSHFVGARADISETQAFANQMHIAAVKMQPEGHAAHHYMINHSAEILLVNPNAEVQAYLSYPHKADQMVKDYKSMLNMAS
jgi:protein SCO1